MEVCCSGCQELLNSTSVMSTHYLHYKRKYTHILKTSTLETNFCWLRSKCKKHTKLLHISILTYAQASLVRLPPLTIPLGAVRLLLGFTLTSSKSMFRICATTWATYEHYRLTVTVSHNENGDINRVKQNLMMKLEHTCMHFYTAHTVYNLVVLWVKATYV